MNENKPSFYRIKTAARSYQMIITNKSGCDMKCTGSSIDHGEWSDNGTPQYIPFNSQGGFETESDGCLTGTAGSVTYELVGGNTTLTITFSVPYDGTNTSSSTLSGASNITQDPAASCPQGNNVTDYMTLKTSVTTLVNHTNSNA